MPRLKRKSDVERLTVIEEQFKGHKDLGEEKYGNIDEKLTVISTDIKLLFTKMNGLPQDVKWLTWGFRMIAMALVGVLFKIILL